jgi:hypothetical protein
MHQLPKIVIVSFWQLKI